MNRSPFVATCLFLAVSLAARALRADQECAGKRPWVAVSGGLPAEFSRTIRNDLRAGLLPSHIEVCEEPNGTGSEPVARVRIEPIGSTARFSLEVTDSVTHKRVGRDLALDKLPPDGRAFALAVATEELLRATWAELALRDSDTPEATAPPEVRAVVAKTESPPVPPRRPVGLGGRLAFEYFLGGQTHYGVDLFGVVPFGRIAGGFAAFGVRRALVEQAPHGAIGGSALSAELGLSLSFWQRAGLELSAFVAARVLRLDFEPEAESGATASSQHGLAVTSRAGLGFAFGKLGSVRAYSTLGTGLPLKSFSASDQGVTITGASKLELFATTGLALELP
ncbi:MAG TPA: hypothetical protein VFK05_01740 [Polyangiaceae bacterium]|nr:hypothetical protein [Polyangiaceae bacterium]